MDVSEPYEFCDHWIVVKKYSDGSELHVEFTSDMRSGVKARIAKRGPRGAVHVLPLMVSGSRGAHAAINYAVDMREAVEWGERARELRFGAGSAV